MTQIREALLYITIQPGLEVSKVMGVPLNHPFLFGILYCMTIPFWVSPTIMETPE